MNHTCHNCKITFKRPFCLVRQNKKIFCSVKCYRYDHQKFSDGDIRIIQRSSSNYGETVQKHKTFKYREIYILEKKKWFFEHRLVMEKKMGKPLKPTDIVHHINGNTLDNRVENLRVFENNTEHLLAHGRIPMLEEVEPDELEIEHFENLFGSNTFDALPNDGYISPKEKRKLERSMEKLSKKAVYVSQKPSNNGSIDKGLMNLLTSYFERFFQRFYYFHVLTRNGDV